MTVPLPGADFVQHAAAIRRVQTMELLRELDRIATSARDLANDDGTDANGTIALRAVSVTAYAMKAAGHTLCAAGGTSDLAALCDNLSDMTARLREAHHTPARTAFELEQMDRDFRNKMNREDAR